MTPSAAGRAAQTPPRPVVAAGEHELPVVIGKLPLVAAQVSIVVGLMVLAAWFAGFVPLQELLPGQPKMVANTATGIVIGGAALLLRCRQPATVWGQRLGLALSGLLVVLGLATLLQYAAGWDLRIDRILPHDPVGTAGSDIVGRPSQYTAGGFAALGLALLLDHADRPRLARLVATGVAILGGVALVGYLYGSRALYAVESYLPYTGMALHTAAAQSLLGLGIALRRPGPLVVAAGEPTAQGLLLRRLIPAAILAPIGVGAVAVVIIRRGWDLTESAALAAVATAALGAALVAMTGLAAARADAARRQSELELVQRERTFADAYERERVASEHLRELADLKSRFVQGISHELRTPLAAIKGFASLIADTAPGELDPVDVATWARRIDANARRLEAQVEDLLDLDRSARGVLTARRRPVDVAAVIDGVLHRLALSDHLVETAVDVGPVLVDPAQVERIVEHLVANAAHHTPPGTRIWVNAEQDDDALLLTVADAGRGVPDANKSEIFEAFSMRGERAESRGVGLGLALVARYAEVHGGRAWVEDRPGGGAAFRVRLPAWPELRRPRLLVVGTPAPHEEVAQLCAAHAGRLAHAWRPDGGTDVAYCAGVLDAGPSCPLVTGGACPLVDAADTVVVTLPEGPERDALITLLRDRRPDATVVIAETPAAVIGTRRGAPAQRSSME